MKILSLRLLGALAAAVIALTTQAQAQPSFANGGFETFTAGTGADRAINASLSGWSFSGSGGYAVVINQTIAQSAGFNDAGTTISFKNASNIVASPAAGNFVAFENPNSDVSNGCNCYLYQTITGLTVNARYTVSFYQAGAAWSGATLATSDYWKVGFGQTYATSSFQNSPTINTPVAGWSGWAQQQMTVIATASTMVLSFMAFNAPAGQPPFALLDGVTFAQQVPEPATTALLITGVAALFGLRRRR
jgi:hypothetical protein